VDKDNVIVRILIIATYFLVLSVLVLVIGAQFGRPLIVVEAENIHVFLSLLGIQNVLLGTGLYIPADRLTFQITWQCSGMFSISLYTLIYLLLPGVRRDVKGWAFGVSFIYLANLLRIVTAIYVYHYFGLRAFTFFHYDVGPVMMFSLVVLLIGDALLRSLRRG